MGGGVGFFLHESFSWGLIRSLPKFRCPRPSGSALKVCCGWGGVDIPIIIITIHSVELNCIELRVDQLLTSTLMHELMALKTNG